MIGLPAGLGLRRPAGGDPHFSSVILLAHADGTDGDTTAVDSSSYAVALASNASATLSNAHPKFGPTGFAVATANGSRWTADAYPSARRLAALDFTFEAFVYAPTGKFVQMGIWGGTISTSARIAILLGDNSALGKLSAWINFYSSWALQLNESGATFTKDTLHYVALRRSGNTFELGLNGAIVASGTLAGSIDPTFDLGDPLTYLVEGGNSTYAPVYADEVRITRGVARDITVVPTAPFPNS